MTILYLAPKLAKKSSPTGVFALGFVFCTKGGDGAGDWLLDLTSGGVELRGNAAVASAAIGNPGELREKVLVGATGGRPLSGEMD